MELSLNLGYPVSVLARMMSERELWQWGKYQRKHLLPFQRIELYLAQLASIIAATMGGHKGAKISDYIIELREGAQEKEDDTRSVEEIRQQAAEAFGFNPRRKK